MKEVEDFINEQQDKRFVIEDRKVYIVLAVLAIGLGRREFFKVAEDFVLKMKDEPDYKDKKLFVYGTVNGQVLHQIWITKYMGIVESSLKSRKKYTWKSIFSKLLKLIR